MKAVLNGTTLTVSPAETAENEQSLKKAIHSVVTDNNRGTITKIVIEAPTNGKIIPGSDFSYLFSDPDCNKYYDSLTIIEGLEKIDTSSVTNMYALFGYCTSLTTLNLSEFDTSNVTDMAFMFDNCSSLTALDVTDFDTSNVTYMNAMFQNCVKLTELDVSSFDTTSVTNMNFMFGNTNLKKLILSDFNTTNVTSMIYMFTGCRLIESLDLSNWDTSSVTSTSAWIWDENTDSSVEGDGSTNMFEYCDSLTQAGIKTTNAVLSDVVQAKINALLSGEGDSGTETGGDDVGTLDGTYGYSSVYENRWEISTNSNNDSVYTQKDLENGEIINSEAYTLVDDDCLQGKIIGCYVSEGEQCYTEALSYDNYKIYKMNDTNNIPYYFLVDDSGDNLKILSFSFASEQDGDICYYIPLNNAVTTLDDIINISFAKTAENVYSYNIIEKSSISIENDIMIFEGYRNDSLMVKTEASTETESNVSIYSCWYDNDNNLVLGTATLNFPINTQFYKATIKSNFQSDGNGGIVLEQDEADCAAMPEEEKTMYLAFAKDGTTLNMYGIQKVDDKFYCSVQDSTSLDAIPVGVFEEE